MRNLNDTYANTDFTETYAKEVEYCPLPSCGCPVVRGGMEAHRRRIHEQYVVPSVVAGRWQREW